MGTVYFRPRTPVPCPAAASSAPPNPMHPTGLLPMQYNAMISNAANYIPDALRGLPIQCIAMTCNTSQWSDVQCNTMQQTFGIVRASNATISQCLKCQCLKCAVSASILWCYKALHHIGSSPLLCAIMPCSKRWL